MAKKKRKLKSPYFVKAKLLKDGTVLMIDDDGEHFHAEMRTDMEWPMLSSAVRNRAMRAVGEKWRKGRDTTEPKPPQPPKGKPRLIFEKGE
jgi:hypothetical protein